MKSTVSSLVFDPRFARGVFYHVADQFLDRLHQVLVGGVRLVELDHGELGIVFRGDSLVSERSSELVDPLKPPYDEPLEVELGGYPQVQVHVQGVVMGDKRSRGGASRDGMEHGGFHLEKIPGVEKASHEAHGPRSGPENLPGPLVGYEIEVALAVPGLHVLESVPFFGKWPERLRQKEKLPDLERKLPGPGPEKGSPDSREISYVKQFAKKRERALVDGVLAYERLDPPRPVRQVEKGAFSEIPFRNDSAREAEGLLQLLEFLGPTLRNKATRPAP